MFEQLFATARQLELEERTREIEARMTWERVSRVDRLQSAVNRAQERLAQALGHPAAAH